MSGRHRLDTDRLDTDRLDTDRTHTDRAADRVGTDRADIPPATWQRMTLTPRTDVDWTVTPRWQFFIERSKDLIRRSRIIVARGKENALRTRNMTAATTDRIHDIEAHIAARARRAGLSHVDAASATSTPPQPR